jgi:hypothetical protein
MITGAHFLVAVPPTQLIVPLLELRARLNGKMI